MRRANRLTTPRDYATTHRTGRRFRAGTVVAIVGTEGTAPPRIGVTSSKRVGNAVARNRAKRRVRAAAVPLIGSLAPGAVVVLQATEAAADAVWKNLESDVRTVLVEAGVLRG